MSKNVVMKVHLPHEQRCRFREAARRSRTHPANALKKLVHAYIELDTEPTTVQVTVTVDKANGTNGA